MNVTDLKESFIGKKLLTIIDVKTDDYEIVKVLREITECDWGDGIDNAQIMLFENKQAILFVDFDSDGYRSGDWKVAHIEGLLDKNQTTGIKHINSYVNDIKYIEDDECKDYFMIITDEYVIKMGQSNSDSYYPSNFFDVEECMSFALKGGVLSMKEENK